MNFFRAAIRRRLGVILWAAGLAALAFLPLIFGAKPDAESPAHRTLTVISPHPETVRAEFGEAFVRHWLEKTGERVRVEWRVVGGTNDIVRFLDAQYASAFGAEWARTHAWDAAARAAYADESATHPARAAFLQSDVGVGIDVFFGGGSLEFARQAARGQLVPMRVFETHPEWFTPAAIPETHAGERIWDAAHRWAGAALSLFGIVYNRDRLEALGLPTPTVWRDLTSPRYFGALALSDPMKSGSVAKCFEMLAQTEMARAATPEEGWHNALVGVQALCANARYFTDAAMRPNLDVAAGDCAAGVGIDFYAKAQAAALAARAPQAKARFGFAVPESGTALSCDPIGILRGAPERDLAEAFVAFVLSPEGQALWVRGVGERGGPRRFALSRLSVRADGSQGNPYALTRNFVYHPEWTGRYFGALRALVKVIGIDTHPELQRAMRAIVRAREQGRDADADAALAHLRAFDDFSYEKMDAFAAALNEPLARQRTLRDAAERLRARYEAAYRIACGEAP